MVKIRPALTNTYVSNIPKMLGFSNTLNTSNIYSKKVKDITMNNEQVAIYNQGYLRDYTGTLLLAFSFSFFYFIIKNKIKKGTKQQGCLRYSPVFCKLMRYNMNFINVNKVLKRNFSTNVDKLDPNWVTGFVDAEGCFSIIIEIPNSLK